MMRESEIHAQFAAYLNLTWIPHRHDRTDKRTRTTLGEPDFLLTKNDRCLYIELKVKGNKLSSAQESRHKFLKMAGNTVLTCYSLEEAVEATSAWLEHIKRDSGHPGAVAGASIEPL